MSSINTNLHSLLQSKQPYFANERMEHFDYSTFHGVPRTTTPASEGSVDLTRVRGTVHSDYSGSTWLELLPTNPDDFTHLEYWERLGHEGKMKRGWRCLRAMRENPTYYLNEEEKEHWGFYKIGSDYYISEGNHRTVVARFLLALNERPEIVRGVSVTEFHIQSTAPNRRRGGLWERVRGWIFA
jgi:hypothetical protein